MSSKFIGFMMFVLGAAVGSAVTLKYVKEKYEQIAQEEIDSVKEAFSKRESEDKNEQPTEKVQVRIRAEQAKDKPSVAEYAAKLREEGYTNYSNPGNVPDEDSEPDSNENEEDKESMTKDAPYVIPPEEFGELYGYEKICLTYYADKVLADDDDELVDDIEEIVGSKSLLTFGKYEDDSVFVRNDRLRCDYEILLDQRKYSDVINKRPHEVDD